MSRFMFLLLYGPSRFVHLNTSVHRYMKLYSHVVRFTRGSYILPTMRELVSILVVVVLAIVALVLYFRLRHQPIPDCRRSPHVQVEEADFVQRCNAGLQLSQLCANELKEL